MKAVIQRVSRAEVRVGGERVSSIGHGMMILLGVLAGDGPQEAERLAQRIVGLRFFADEADRMNRSAAEVGAACLVVSQITLAWDGTKGRRPSLDRAAAPEEARALVGTFVAALRAAGIPCQEGRFGAMMEVELVNCGPVTLLLEEVPPGTAEKM